MPSLDSLPADQRAVLELVLRQGRGYDEIARLLAVDRAGVRRRALAALDAIGPRTEVPPESRGLIADYLLGQLPPRVSDTVRERLGRSPSEFAWTHALASELAQISRDPLPEIPVAPDGQPTALGDPEPPRGRPRRSSRRGGAVVLTLAGAAIAAAVVVGVVLALGGGGSAGNHASTAAAQLSSSTTSTSAAAQARVVAQITLQPTAAATKAQGVAQVVRVGENQGIVLVARGMPANTKRDFYAVWLFNSITDERLIGFVSPGVGANGQMETTGALPANVAHYRSVLISLETHTQPKAPTRVVLHGALSLP
ncbi:MAG: sigma-70 region 4 domain-containing protein [Solirubrobacterales bacterium]|nr:sigma-70 region 4 domain-containing protein [Solirubrobacterales bacterium]